MKSSRTAKIFFLLFAAIVIVALLVVLVKSDWLRSLTGKKSTGAINPPTAEQQKAANELTQQIKDYYQQKYQK